MFPGQGGGNRQQQQADYSLKSQAKSLEDAALAAKYLDKSDNAKAAIELATKREETRKLELEENKVKLEIQRATVSEEERRKTIQYETEMSKRRAEYSVQLDLQRDQEKMKHKE